MKSAPFSVNFKGERCSPNFNKLKLIGIGTVSYPRLGRISNCFYEWTGMGPLLGLGEARGRFLGTHFFEVGNCFCQSHEIHTFGAMEF